MEGAMGKLPDCEEDGKAENRVTTGDCSDDPSLQSRNLSANSHIRTFYTCKLGGGRQGLHERKKRQ